MNWIWVSSENDDYVWMRLLLHEVFLQMMCQGRKVQSSCEIRAVKTGDYFLSSLKDREGKITFFSDLTFQFSHRICLSNFHFFPSYLVSKQYKCMQFWCFYLVIVAQHTAVCIGHWSNSSLKFFTHTSLLKLQ